jgi:SAM-dependent methyltransferase
VQATDPSDRQLAQAQAHARVTYRPGTERDSGLASSSADLVIAAQAFHWFDGDAFFAEAARVLRPGGALAIWCYGLSVIDAAVDPVMRHFHQNVVGADWPQGRALVDDLYRGVRLPFPEIAAPAFHIERDLDLPALGQYVATWSAVQRHRARTGVDPMPALLTALAGVWGDPGTPRRVTWPIGMRAGRASL